MEREKVVVVVVILFVVVEGGGVVVVDYDADEAATAAVVSDWHKTLSRVESKKVKQWYLTVFHTDMRVHRGPTRPFPRHRQKNVVSSKPPY